MRILHVLHHSTPYLDGYGIRSKYIVDFQRRLGLEPVVLTSGHHEMEIGRKSGAPATETFDGVAYHRTHLPASQWEQRQLNVPLLRELALMRWLDASLARVLETERIDVVHSHSPVLCGRPALRAARRRGIPMVYEVRAFWEDGFLLGPDRFGVGRAVNVASRGLETSLLRRVDAAVAISRHMVADIGARGLEPSRLFQIPNGVDVGRFAAMERDETLATRLGLGDSRVVGFIGTLHHIEGLDCLIDAMRGIVSKVPSTRLVIVGTGPEADALKQQVARLGLQGVVLQVGRVPHEQVPNYYSVMDVLVYPRHRNRITELVTPLKPLEAMALGKAVIGSDVGGITELLDDGRAGVIFKAGDSQDLTVKVVDLLTNPTALARAAAEGRAYVLAQRSWEAIVPRYLPIYEQVAARAGRSST